MNPSEKYSPGHLFVTPAVPLSGEVFEELLRCHNVRIERIVSSDRPDPAIYDQEQHEWVCLLQGNAELWLEGERVTLCAGDHLFIPAHTPHRVLRTSGDPPCIWLAVHVHPDREAANADRNG